jgi:hypothetical protein
MAGILAALGIPKCGLHGMLLLARILRFGLGKVLAQRIIPELQSGAEPRLTRDSSTNNLIREYRQLRSAA